MEYEEKYKGKLESVDCEGRVTQDTCKALIEPRDGFPNCRIKVGGHYDIVNHEIPDKYLGREICVSKRSTLERYTLALLGGFEGNSDIYIRREKTTITCEDLDPLENLIVTLEGRVA